MKKSDFYYNLPQEFIAQTPVEPRDSSRMMVVDKKSGKIEHKHFYDVLDYINENDCIIINDTRVLPARIYGVKKDTGAVVEFLLLSQKENDVWECVTGPGRRAKPGTVFDFNGLMSAEVVSVLDGGNRLVRFIYEGNFYNILDQIGEMPLPHYITEKLEDKERYQTVYSENLGSAAAPTAGLHFTPELLAKIEQKGIKIGKVTLHVGLGTFRPVKEENIENHLMHSEHYHLPVETADLINATHANGGRVFAVGTTTCRTLESVATKHGKIIEDDDWTSIFIYPGYQFKCIDSLITNFHLPESTLIMLVSAFAGYENTMNAYKIAVEEKYRFFSFGDSSMFTDLK
ncbi:MAG: tRNA preQ1(34) S-adenosylmethionine ribosyltransferase-isomerase QueA [Acutalibacteraceae bacterium]|nr:tRNA preQ1(34) S-adenosylmethionine ribosyltransferase-isomerase QueA [Acutalibacteraceae bacterium]